MLGEFIQPYRDELVVATKYAVGAGRRGISRTGDAAKNLRLSVEESLQRLNTDYVDVLWVHYPDALTPIDEILRGLDLLARQGKILAAGFSNFPGWRVARASALADVHGMLPVAGIQVEYSLVERGADRELLPMAEALGIGVTLWSPLGGGLLTGKYRFGSEGRLTTLGRLVHTESTPQKIAIVDALLQVAGEHGRPASHIAIAWLNERSRRLATTSIPIIGPRSVTQLDDYLAALDVELSPAHFDMLCAVSQPELGVPHESNAGSLDLLQGGVSALFDRPLVPVA